MQRFRFHWQETPEQLAAFAARYPGARADARGRAFVATAPDGSVARCIVPFVLPPPAPGEEPLEHAARLRGGIGRQCVVLLQAGAAALGYWDEDELLRHKAYRRYVVRGSGKAQYKHLDQKGKSRYGSRLRLQNWRRLLSEVSQRLRDDWEEYGAPEQVFWAIPVRARGPFFATDPAPPFRIDDRVAADGPVKDPSAELLPRVRRLPLHVHVPDHRELLAVRRWLVHGRLELPTAADPAQSGAAAMD